MSKLDKLQFAYVSENDIRNIKGANKNEKYFLDKYLTIPLVYCKGEKVVDYWRKEKSIDNKTVKDFFKSSESIEHYNKKMEIYFSQEFKTKDCIFIGSDAQEEYRIKDKIIDVVLFDDDKNPLVGIEVYYTNKKTKDDVKKLEKLKFPIYEYNIKTKKSYPLCCGVTETNEIKLFQKKIFETNTQINRDKIRIDRGRELLQKQYKDIEELERVTEKWWIENEIREIEREIREIEEKIKFIGNYRGRINDYPFPFPLLKRERSERQREIDQVENEIKQFENVEREAKEIKKEGFTIQL